MYTLYLKTTDTVQLLAVDLPFKHEYRLTGGGAAPQGVALALHAVTLQESCCNQCYTSRLKICGGIGVKCDCRVKVQPVLQDRQYV